MKLGQHFTSQTLATLSKDEKLELATAFADYFDCETPQAAQIERAIKATLVRWPSQVTIYYLEMRSPTALNPKPEASKTNAPKPDSKGITIQECKIKQPELNRFLYQFVGKDWGWTDRLPWTEEQWQAYVNQANLRTWVAYCQGAIAGYYELKHTADNSSTEIIYFGLTPQFIGQGMGGYLLTQAIQTAWQWENTRRVWVHTCSKDHPHALKNYEARGFEIYKVETA